MSNCTEVCKSCSKICLVTVYPAGDRNKGKKIYAMLDDQSNKSLARTKFFDMLKINSPTLPYTLRTCSGMGETAGRRATGYVIESADGAIKFSLPTLLECNLIPDNRDEIPTSAATYGHRHLRSIAHEFPPLDPSAHILLLLGRDILRVHKVCRQISGPHDAAYAQKLL